MEILLHQNEILPVGKRDVGLVVVVH